MHERELSFINDAVEIDLEDGEITVHVINKIEETLEYQKFDKKNENLPDLSDILSQNELPSYSSLDFIADEPPKYEVVTGKKLSDGIVRL